MGISNKCITACAVLLIFILVISTAGAIADNNSTNVFNADTYQLPVLQFNDLQQKVVVSKALSPTEENTAIRAFNAGAVPADDIIQGIPQGSIIHHSVDGITTVFDKDGIQLISADDASAGLISIPGGYKPATMVHELPSGSVLYPSGNITYVVFNDKVILVEINDNPIDTATVSEPAPINNTPSRVRAEPMGASSAMDFDPNKVFLERVGLEHYFSTYDDDIKVSSVQWVVPAAPKTVRPSQIQYLEFIRVANDFVYYYDNSTPGGVKSYNSVLYFATVSEWNRYSNTWDMSSWIQNTNISRPTYYSTGIHVNTGNKLTGEIISRYDYEGHDYYNWTEYWSAGISNPAGQTSNLSLVARNMESVLNTGNPVEYLFEVSGDNYADSEDNFIGDTPFSDFIFTSQKDLPISAGSIPVWCVYVHSWFNGKPQFKDMRIENKWPVSLLFGTQAPAPVGYTFSITNTDGAINKTTGIWTWNEQARNDIDYMKTYFTTDTNWNNVHWNLIFSEEWPQVTKGNFGVNPLPVEHTLNEATLHYHTGHGYSNTDGTYSFLRLLDQDLPLPNIDMSPTEVEGKWGGSNKWVILSSCYVLRDQRWGKAFASSHPTHGIMGYKTESYPRNTFMTTFFEYAKTNSVRDSYLLTVKQLDLNSMVQSPDGKPEHLTAVTVFSNQSLAENDYLPGYGSGIQPDADKVILAWKQWPPQSEGGV